MNYYPNRVYPETPDFPSGHDDVPIGSDLYTAVASYITAMSTDAARLFVGDGNITLGATYGVMWNGVTQINLAGGEIHLADIQVTSELIVDTPTITTLNITGDLVVSNDLIVDGDIAVTGTVTQDYVDREELILTQAAEPGDPADNNAVFWISNGTGYGDVGDLCCKITEGGGTADFTISDYSTLGFLRDANKVEMYTIGGTEYAFVAAPGGNGIYIIDVSTPATPAYVTRIENKTYAEDVSWLTLGTVGGTEYLWILSATDGSFSCIDVSTPAAPSLIDTYQQAGSPDYLGDGHTILFYDIGGTEHLIVGTSFGFNLYDISTPATPSSVSLTNSNGVQGGINVGTISGTEYVFLSSSNSPYYQIWDISTPASPSKTDDIGYSATNGYRYPNSTIISISGTEHVVRDDNVNGLLRMFDVSTPSAISSPGSLSTSRVLDIDVGTVGGTEYAFVVEHTTDTVKIIDISTPATPSVTGTLTGDSLIDSPSGVTFVTIGGTEYLIVVSATSHSLAMIDISTPATPARVGAIDSI